MRSKPSVLTSKFSFPVDLGAWLDLALGRRKHRLAPALQATNGGNDPDPDVQRRSISSWKRTLVYVGAALLAKYEPLQRLA